MEPQARGGKAIAMGAGLMILLRVGERAISLVSFSLLARLLYPDDYGLFALALTVIATVETIGSWGFDSALIQRHGADRSYYDTAWTMKVMAGAVVAGAVCIAAIPAARIFAEPRVEPVLYWLALATLVAGLENVGTVDFLKTLDYRRELIYRLAVRLVTTVVAIALAYAWRSYWALVAGQVVGTAATVALSYAAHPFRPRWSLARFRGLVGFTRWIFLRNVLQRFSDQVANIVVGRGVGVSALAYFTFARELADVATSDLYAPIRRALFPAYAAVKDDLAALKRLVLDSTALMTLIGLPMSVGMAVVAPDAVRVLLGDRWTDVGPLLQILAIAGCVGSRVSGAPALYIAMGRPDVAAKLAAFRLALLAALISLGVVAAATTGAAWAMVASAILTGIVNWRLIGRTLGLSRAELWRVVHRPIAAAALMAVVVLASLAALPDGQSFASALFRLATGVAVGMVAYGVALVMAWILADRPAGAEQQVLDLLVSVRRRMSTPNRRVAGDAP